MAFPVEGIWLPTLHSGSVCNHKAKYVLAGLISGTGPYSNPSLGTKLGQVNAGTYAIGLISWAVSCHQVVLIWYQRKLGR